MKKILIRADDLGYSRAVNYGIYDSVHCGIVNNVGVMVNMKSTEMGLELLKNENIDLGMHTNISNGKPILPANKIPSLVDRKGYFKSSHEYRQPLIVKGNLRMVDYIFEQQFLGLYENYYSLRHDLQNNQVYAQLIQEIYDIVHQSQLSLHPN